MTREQHRAGLRAFLETIRRPDRPVDQLPDDAPLVAAGLIDSLAMVEIILYLESEVGIDFSEAGVEPETLRSVASILDLIERHGK